MIRFITLLVPFLFNLPMAYSQRNDVEFSYDANSSIGPNNWKDIDVTNSEYWQYFKEKYNMCDGKGQSPVDLKPNAICTDDHPIRSKVNFYFILLFSLDCFDSYF